MGVVSMLRQNLLRHTCTDSSDRYSVPNQLLVFVNAVSPKTSNERVIVH